MKFIVSSSALLKQVQMVSGALNNNSPLDILTHFLFDIDKNELSITASDLETTITTRIAIESKEKGKIAVSARLLSDMLKTFGDEPLSFTINPKTFGIEVSTGQGKFKLTGLDGNDYPKIPEVTNANFVDMPSEVLSQAISKTLFATGTDDLRPVMMGVYCQLSPDDVLFVATDAHRLVRYKRTDARAQNNVSFILPKKPLTLLRNIVGNDEKVRIDYNDSNAFFSFGDVKLVCRFIEGRYPNYEAVIPKENPNKLTIDRSLFLSTIRRVAIFSSKTTHQVKFKITGSQVAISAEDADFNHEGNEVLSCSYEGVDMEIAFNSKFLVEMLNNLDTEEITMHMSLPNRAGLITPVGMANEEDVLMLVMPVMISN